MGTAESAPRKALVFDIETIADLTAANHDAVAALAKGREMTAEHYGGLCPPLARIVCIAWFDVATQQLGAHFDATLLDEAPPSSIDVDAAGEMAAPPLRCALHACDGEAALLRGFGQRAMDQMTRAPAQLVTYNGRGFDLPVLIHRAIKHGVREGRDLFTKAARENRFNPQLHLDLMDVVTFSGAAGRFPLAAYAIGYGFKSPKQEMDGSQVWSAIQAGRIVDVVRYCAGDVVATAHVYRRLFDVSAAPKP